VLLTLRVVLAPPGDPDRGSVVARATPGRALAAGLALGLALLCRQWAFLLAPAIAVFIGVCAWRDLARRRPLAIALALLLATAALTAAPFYLRLPREEGGIAAFNRRPHPGWSLRNQPAAFYLDLGLDRLFRDPVRPSFPNRLLPTLYSETWGDYWGFFLVTARDRESGQHLQGRRREEALTAQPRPERYETNRDQIAPYLGRVNLAGLVPFAAALAGLGWGAARVVRFARGDTDSAAPALFTLVVAATFAGYLAFLVRYPELTRGDTIKATYLLQAFPFVALLAASALAALRERSRRWHGAAVLLLLLAWMHNVPAMVTRHVP
jgi:hypothetical protein